MAWWPEDEWRQMWDGVGCGMCRDASLARNPFGDLIVETDHSFVRLCNNQTQAGYSVVVAKRHAPELHHLAPDERCGLWDDVAVLGEVISDLLKPVKLANLAMGFRMPHFHVHVYPQFQDDDPFQLINPQDGDVRLADSDWEERLGSIRTGFLALRSS